MADRSTATARERPVLFSGPMVKAILAGQKTMTRRVVALREFQRSETPGYDWTWRDKRMLWQDVSNAALIGRSPYGVSGDRLYVKESAWMWCEKRPDGLTKKTKQPMWRYVELRTAPHIYCIDRPEKPSVSVVSPNTGNTWGWRKKIGRFLPHWASRLTLEITSIRVERLQDITEEDAVAEGIHRISHGRDGFYYHHTNVDPSGDDWIHAEDAFRNLWDSINGKRPGCSWESNCWVCVVGFKRVESGEVAA